MNQSAPPNVFTKKTLRLLFDHITIQSHKKNAAIWTKGESAHFCYLLSSGFVEITDTSRVGEERIYGLFGPHDVIGLSASIRKVTYPASAIVASQNCKTININVTAAMSRLSSSAKNEFQQWMPLALAQHETILRQKIVILGSGLLSEKLIEMFDHLAQRFSDYKTNDQKQIFIPAPITKTHIAKFVGFRVESVIRELNKWERAGLLNMNSDGVMISPFEIIRNQYGSAKAPIHECNLSTNFTI